MLLQVKVTRFMWYFCTGVPFQQHTTVNYQTLIILSNLILRRKGRRRRATLVLVQLVHHCTSHYQLPYSQSVPSRFCNFSRKERKRKHVHLPTPLVSRIYFLAWLVQSKLDGLLHGNSNSQRIARQHRRNKKKLRGKSNPHFECLSLTCLFAWTPSLEESGYPIRDLASYLEVGITH